MQMQVIENVYKFDFTWSSKLRIQHSERALLVAKKKKSLLEISHEQGCSTTSLRNSYQKVCRNIYWQLITKFEGCFKDVEMAELYQSQFKCEKGIMLIENFYHCMKSLENISPSPNMLDNINEDKLPEKIYNEKINLIADRMSKKRIKMIEQINHDFDLLDKWLKDL